jgi:hypothetical protein
MLWNDLAPGLAVVIIENSQLFRLAIQAVRQAILHIFICFRIKYALVYM